MVPVGECYRPRLGFSLAQGLAALVLGLLGAAGAAGLIWVWEWSGIPTLMVLTSVLQGVILGGVLMYLVQRLKLRSKLLAAALGVVCGLSSAALVHVGHYLYFVNVGLGRQIEADQTLPAREKATLLKLYQQNRQQFADAILDDQTRHKGLVGYMIARSEDGLRVRNAHWTGWAVVGLWGFEAFLVVCMAVVMPAGQASVPFCEDCEAWCDKRTGLPAYPPEVGEPLAEAVRLDDRVAVERLAPQRVMVVEGPTTSTTLHVCPECAQSFADVDVMTVEGKKVKSKSLVKRQRVSPEMVEALGKPVERAEEPADGPTEGRKDEEAEGVADSDSAGGE